MRLRLSVAVPIRVGGREQQITKLEFVSHGGTLHVVSSRRLGEVLLQKGERTLDDWNVEVLTKGQNADLTSFLRKRDLLEVNALQPISRYSVPSSHRGVNQFQPHARDAWGELFVPGSAIKGAIRAAVLWDSTDNEMVNRYVQDNSGDRARFYARKLDQDVLQSYGLPGRQLRPGPNFDLLRAVKVSDAYGDLRSRLEKIVVQSYIESRGKERRTTLGASETIYVECLEAGSWAEFDLKVDGKVLEDFRKERRDLPFTDEESLLNLVRRFYEEAWRFEQRYYGIASEVQPDPTDSPAVSGPPSFEDWLLHEKGIEAETLSRRTRRPHEAEYRRTFDLFGTDYGREEPPDQGQALGMGGGVQDGEVRVGRIREYYAGACPGFRLGWGSGLMSTTVDMHLEPDNLGKVLRLISSRHHRGEPRDGPKSRKLVDSERGPAWPMGWSNLEKV